MKKALCLLVAVLIIFTFAACGNDDKEASGGTMKDPYEAYGLERGKSYEQGKTLEMAMSENPPAVIRLKPVFYYRAHYETIAQSGEILLEKGKNANISLDLELVHNTGKKSNIKSNITLKYDGKKGEDLLHADTSTYGDPTLYIDGKYVHEFRNHVIKNKAVSLEYITAKNGYNYKLDGLAEEFLCIPLFVDKGNATKADGNIGTLYCRIVGIKR